MGLSSNVDAQTIMNDIYHVLRKLNFVRTPNTRATLTANSDTHVTEARNDTHSLDSCCRFVCVQEWKVLSLYKLKARYPAGLLDMHGKLVSSSEVCKIGIQLYKASATSTSGGGVNASVHSSSASTPVTSPHLGPNSPPMHPAAATGHAAPHSAAAAAAGAAVDRDLPSGTYVLDMQKLCGQMFLFIELANSIVGGMQHVSKP